MFNNNINKISKIILYNIIFNVTVCLMDYAKKLPVQNYMHIIVDYMLTLMIIKFWALYIALSKVIGLKGKTVSACHCMITLSCGNTIHYYKKIPKQ